MKKGCNLIKYIFILIALFVFNEASGQNFTFVGNWQVRQNGCSNTFNVNCINPSATQPFNGTQYTYSNGILVPSDPQFQDLQPVSGIPTCVPVSTCIPPTQFNAGTISTSYSGGTFSINGLSATGGSSPYEYLFEYTYNGQTNSIGWQSSTSASFSINITPGTTINVTQKARATCGSSTIQLSTQYTAPCAMSASLLKNPTTTVNPGDAVILTASVSSGSGSYSYNWGNLGTGGTIRTVNPTTTTTYNVYITDNSTGCTSQANVTVVVNTPCIAPTSGGTISVAQSTGATGQPITISSVTPATGGSGGTLEYLFYYLINGSPTLFHGPTSSPSATFTPTQAKTYCFQRVARMSCNVTQSATSNTTSCVTVVNSSCNLTAAASSSPSSITSGSSATLSVTPSGGSGSYTYNWSNGLGTGSSKTVSPTSTTTYTVTVTDNNTSCTATASTTVTVNSSGGGGGCGLTGTISKSPSGNNNPPGTTFSLSVSVSGGSGGYTYQWNTGQTAASISVSPSSNTSYSVTVTDVNTGCTITKYTSVNVQINCGLAYSVTNSSPTVTAGGSSTLGISGPNGTGSLYGGSGNYTYNWSNGGSDTSTTVSPTATTTYYVTITDNGTGCSTVGNTVVTVSNGCTHYSRITSSSYGASQTQLRGHVFNGSGNYTYNWSNGGTGFSTIISPVSSLTHFYLTVTDVSTGCQAVNSITLVPPGPCSPPPSWQTVGSISATPDPAAVGSPITINNVTFPTGGSGASNYASHYVYEYQVKQPGSSQWLTIKPSGHPNYTGSTSTVYIPTITGVYQFRRRVGVQCGQNTYMWTSNGYTPIVSVTVVSCSNVTNAGSILGNESNCGSGGSFDPSLITPLNPPSGGAGGLEYQWQYSTGSTWINITGATGASYDPPTISTTTQYRRGARRTCSSFSYLYTTAVTKTISSTPLTVNISATNTSICSGSSTNLTASGATSAYSYSWSNGLGSGSFKTVSPTSTTTYYVTVTENGCTNSNAITINITPNSVGGIVNSSSSTVCASTSNFPIGFFTLSGHIGNVVRWEWSTDNTNWTDWGGGGSASSPSGWMNSSGTFYARALVQSGSCASAYSSTSSVTVQQPTIITQPTDVSVCQSSSGTFTVAANSTGLSYQWYLSNDGANLGSTASETGNTTPSITVTNTNLYYAVVVTDGNGCSITSDFVTLNEITPITDGGTITANETNCGNFNPTNITETVAASGGNGGAIEYIWEQSTDGGITWTTISGANSTSYNPNTISQTTLYRRGARRSPCSTPYTYSNIIVKEVTAPYTDAGTISSDQIVCVGDAISNITGTFPTGGSGAIEFIWEQSTNGGSTWSVISGSTTLNYQPTGLTNTTMFQRGARGSGCGAYLYSNTVTKTIIGGGSGLTITSQPTNATVCQGNPGTFTVTASGTGLTYQWHWSNDGSTIGGTATETGNTTASITVTNTNLYYAVVITDANGCNITSNFVQLNAINNITDGGTIASNETNCGSFNPANIISSSPASGGSSSISISYQWQSSTDNITWTNITGATSETYNPPTITQTTYYRRGARRNPCTSYVYSNTITKEVSTPYNSPGTIASDETICLGNNAATITGSLPTGGTGSIEYIWQSSTDGGATWSVIGGATASSYQPLVLTDTTQFRRGARGSSCSSYLYSNVVNKYVVNNGGGGLSFQELQKLLASDGQSNDWFGFDVSISGDYAIIGAFKEDQNGSNAGAAYIYQNINNVWIEVKKLVASDGQSGDNFGYSVSISGDYAIVGAIYEDQKGNNAGAAYIFEKNTGGTNNWGEVKKLTSSFVGHSALFGWDVSISGDYAIVGAYNEYQSGSSAGAAYIFEKNTGGTNNWGEVKRIISSDIQSNDHFGNSVSISNNYVIVGALDEDQNGNNAGAAYIFEKNTGGTNNWGEVKKLIASDGQSDDWFGHSVSISDDYAIIGAYLEDQNGSNAGAAYIFEKNTGGTNNWGEVKKLIASDGQSGNWFGHGVSILDDYAIVGALGGKGSAYIFEKNTGGTNNWGEVKKLIASDGQGADYFGNSVSMSSNHVIIGAFREDQNGSDAGAAYLFSTNPDTAIIQDTICQGETVTVGTQTFNSTGLYLVPLTDANGCDSTIKYDLIVVDSLTDGGIIAADEQNCSGSFNPANITSTSPASGGSASIPILYQWQSSIDGITWTNITGATSGTYDPPTITQTTYYRRGARPLPCTNYVYSNVVTKTTGGAIGDIDTDGDGYTNQCDLDDDNDGILDAIECEGVVWTNPTITSATTATAVFNTPITITSTNANSFLGAGTQLITIDENENTTITINLNSPLYGGGIYFSSILYSAWGNFVITTVDGTVFTIADFPSPLVASTNRYGFPLQGGSSLLMVDNGSGFFVAPSNSDGTNQGYGSFTFDVINNLSITDPGKAITTIQFDVQKIVNNNYAGEFGIFGTNCDDDLDGILNSFDTDSDNDGCPDAIEGSGNFTYTNIQNDTLTGGVDANGVPTIANGGQGIGSSNDSSVTPCCTGTFNNLFNLTGNANIQNGYIQLTPNTTSQFGRAALSTNLDLSHDFNLIGRLFLGSNDGSGGDGLNLVFENTAEAVFFFDTYQNPNDYFSFYSTINGTLGNSIDLGNIEDNAWHDVEIDWEASTKNITVIFDGNIIYTLNRDIVNLDLGGNPNVFFKIQAWTGGAFNEQAICVNALNYTTPCPAGSVPPTLASDEGCTNSTFNLNSLLTSAIPSGSNLVWFTNNTHTGTPYSTPSAAVPGTYYAFYYHSGNNCYSPASNAVTVQIQADITNITSTNPTCGQNNGSITIHFNDNPTRTHLEFSLDGGNTYQTAIPDNSGFVTYSNLSDGSYSIYVRWQGEDCPHVVGVRSLVSSNGPSVTASADQTICTGENVNLTANATGGTGTKTYQWNDNTGTPVGTGASIFLTPTTTTTYSVIATDASGCTAIDMVTVTVRDLPTATLSKIDPTSGFNNGSITMTYPNHPTETQLQFSLNGGSSYQPVILDNTNSTTYNSLASGSYTIYARWGDGGCPVLIGSINLINSGSPVVEISDITICSGTSTTLQTTASAGMPPYSFSWSHGLGSGTSKTVMPTVTTTYTVTVTDANGASSTDQAIVTVTPLPSATISQTDASCGQSNGRITFTFADEPSKNSIQFSLDGGSTYQTAVPDNSGSVTYTDLAAGSYVLYAKWGDNSCPTSLGNITLNNVVNPVFCNPSLAFQKSAMDNVQAGTMFSYTFTFVNNTGVILNNITFRDTLSDGMLFITDARKLTNGIQVTGIPVRDSIAELTLDNIPIGTSSFEMYVHVPLNYIGANPFCNQAYLHGLVSNNPNLSDIQPSDNPNTGNSNDATCTYIWRPEICDNGIDDDLDGNIDCDDSECQSIGTANQIQAGN